ncbi:diacylglycerol/lipid kinase family protein [Maricaulis sp.]|uniref:diacylglycerol/lipid kinase family protein n=1 Tax=Maricaulis sp. TaxID=1486257 RepID=UPI003A8D13C8
MKTLAIILNPRAGSARAFGDGELRDAIAAAAGWAELEFFDASDDVPGAARAACASGADAVVTAGGDGTAAAVLDAARDSGCASLMVPLPLGTANMLPRRLYGDRDFRTVLTELPDYRAVTLHAGEVSGHTFYVALMAGMPVHFGQAREALRPDGAGRRLNLAFKRLRQGLASMARPHMRLKLDDGERRVSRSCALVVAPGGFSAVRGGADAPGPAVLEHLLMQHGDPADFALKTASFLAGLPTSDEAVLMSRQPATLSGPKRIELMLDGEVIKAATPIEICLVENAATFAAPAD